MKTDPMEKDVLEDILERKGFIHLNVRKHGDHLVIYSTEDGEKVNRARLTKVTAQYYQIGMADHRGRWESTPFRGTMEEMVTLLTTDFNFALAPW
ncbi:hypothetical protein ACUL41_00245 [Virgibacillus natechei]|uniref:hypothetical protein n=1 Tax=Virgibacillus sp. CBA3643 TaxID=2942278 RepID=UPI0035A29A2D